jgi:hypothetical protein
LRTWINLKAADNLRASSGLASNEYCMPVLGVIFLRRATNRYDAASHQIAVDQAAGRMGGGHRPRDRAVRGESVILHPASLSLTRSDDKESSQ